MVGGAIEGGKGSMIVVDERSLIVVNEGLAGGKGMSRIVVAKYVIFVACRCREGKIVGEVVCWCCYNFDVGILFNSANVLRCL